MINVDLIFFHADSKKNGRVCKKKGNDQQKKMSVTIIKTILVGAITMLVARYIHDITTEFLQFYTPATKGYKIMFDCCIVFSLLILAICLSS